MNDETETTQFNTPGMIPPQNFTSPTVGAFNKINIPVRRLSNTGGQDQMHRAMAANMASQDNNPTEIINNIDQTMPRTLSIEAGIAWSSKSEINQGKLMSFVRRARLSPCLQQSRIRASARMRRCSRRRRIDNNILLGDV